MKQDTTLADCCQLKFSSRSWSRWPPLACSIVIPKKELDIYVIHDAVVSVVVIVGGRRGRVQLLEYTCAIIFFLFGFIRLRPCSWMYPYSLAQVIAQ